MKKLFLCLLMALLITGGWFLFIHKEKPVQIYEKQSNLPDKTAMALKTELDSDNDGLKDWEEALWKTDPKNPDTDGDGTPDGEEIKQWRNPVVKGPGDKLSEIPAEIIENQTASLESNSFTNNINQQVIDELKLLGQSGQPLTKEDKTNFINSVVEMLSRYEQNTTVSYGLNDLKVSSNSSESSLKEYGNKLSGLIYKYFDSIPENEIQALNKLVAGKDESRILMLGQLADAYENTAKDALLMEVPAPLSTNHLTVINTFLKIADQIRVWRQGYADPALGIATLQQYLNTRVSARKALVNINVYLQKNNIIFNKGEYGRILVYFYRPDQNEI